MGPVEFMTNRVVRVAPLYWALTLGIFALAALVPALVGATQADPGKLVKSLLFIPFDKGNGLIQPLLFQGWTLNLEMVFYGLFACRCCSARCGYRWRCFRPCCLALSPGASLPRLATRS